MYNYNYCVYLNNQPYIDNDGMIFSCCKNRKTRLPYNIKDMPLIDMFNSPEFIETRKQMAEGIMPFGCEPCYSAEAKGQKDSFRIRSLKGVRYRDHGPVKDQSIYITPYADTKIRALDLRLGSTCNLTCVMCYPSDSNSWHKIFEDYARTVNRETENAINITMDRYDPKKLNWAEDPKAWDNIFCSIDEDVKRIYLAGGEPFYIKGFEDYLVELYNKCPQAFIEINTNATRLLPEKYLQKLKGANLGIRVSIDGIGSVDEYVRQGTKWEEKVQVIDQYHTCFNITSFDITVNSLNVHNLPDTLEWIKHKYINNNDFPKILVRPVINQKGLGINVLPLHERQDILKRLNAVLDSWPNYQRNVNIGEIIPKLSDEQVNEIDKLGRILNFWEQRSKISYENINPNLFRWVNEHSSS
jgi:molybdenum cofactor biosynthesis enzyme MoaA